MKRILLAVAVALGTTLGIATAPAHAQHSGGHPGGFHPGGGHPGGFHPGGFHPGGFHPGGFHPGGFHPGGFHPGGHPGYPGSYRWRGYPPFASGGYYYPWDYSPQYVYTVPAPPTVYVDAVPAAPVVPAPVVPAPVVPAPVVPIP
jgi:hypothetical protein